MSHRVNVMLDDEVWEQLREVPQGERSRLINEAVQDAMLRRRRAAAWGPPSRSRSGQGEAPWNHRGMGARGSRRTSLMQRFVVDASVILEWVLPSDADQDLKDLTLQLGACERPASRIWQREILRLTTAYPVTFYDAAYHALAVVESGVYITADETYGTYLLAVGGEVPVRHLKEWR